MLQQNPALLIASFIHAAVSQNRRPRPLVFGLSGPQGCGKTTATGAATSILRDRHHLNGITVSIDDFYLEHDAQLRLALQHPDNPYLQQRGYPGTHDIELGVKTLAALRSVNTGTGTGKVRIPRYDKSLHDGEGDRLPESSWTEVTPPLDFVILEGWCVGFTPLPGGKIADRHLAEINRLLQNYAVWHDFFCAFIWLKARDIGDTVRWRIEAEQKMRAAGKPAMSDEKIRAYIERFLPAYRLYLPGLAQNIPVTSPRLEIEILSDRSVGQSIANL